MTDILLLTGALTPTLSRRERELDQHPPRIKWLQLKWLHING
jgi:hypothetical protein